MDVTTATPAEIDTEFVQVDAEEARKVRAAHGAVMHAAYYATGAYETPERERYGVERATRLARETDHAFIARVVEAVATLDTPATRELTAAIDAHHAAVRARKLATDPYREEYDRRGGWSRFYHVTNTNGHTHSSTHCGTCFPSTVFGWVTSLSGSTEAELVAVMGDAACTVCFPTAPTLSGYGDGTSYVAKASAAEKAERAAVKATKAAAKAAKGITTRDGEPLRERNYRTGEHTGSVIKTERTARGNLVSWLADIGFDRFLIDNRPEHVESLRVSAGIFADAIAAKNGQTIDELWVELAPKVRAKAKRDRLIF